MRMIFWFTESLRAARRRQTQKVSCVRSVGNWPIDWLQDLTINQIGVAALGWSSGAPMKKSLDDLREGSF